MKKKLVLLLSLSLLCCSCGRGETDVIEEEIPDTSTSIHVDMDEEFENAEAQVDAEIPRIIAFGKEWKLPAAKEPSKENAAESTGYVILSGAYDELFSDDGTDELPGENTFLCTYDETDYNSFYKTYTGWSITEDKYGAEETEFLSFSSVEKQKNNIVRVYFKDGAYIEGEPYYIGKNRYLVGLDEYALKIAARSYLDACVEAAKINADVDTDETADPQTMCISVEDATAEIGAATVSYEILEAAVYRNYEVLTDPVSAISYIEEGEGGTDARTAAVTTKSLIYLPEGEFADEVIASYSLEGWKDKGISLDLAISAGTAEVGASYSISYALVGQSDGNVSSGARSTVPVYNGTNVRFYLGGTPTEDFAEIDADKLTSLEKDWNLACGNIAPVLEALPGKDAFTVEAANITDGKVTVDISAKTEVGFTSPSGQMYYAAGTTNESQESGLELTLGKGKMTVSLPSEEGNWIIRYGTDEEIEVAVETAE